MQEWIKKNGKVVHICSTCENEKHMSGDLSDCICGDAMKKRHLIYFAIYGFFQGCYYASIVGAVIQ